MRPNVFCTVYDLKTESGGYLGRVVLTGGGMLSGVTDYGDFAYSWRAYGDSFEDFILKISPDYFASKIEQSMAYMVKHTKSSRASCLRLAEHVLPALQAEILRDRKTASAPETSQPEPQTTRKSWRNFRDSGILFMINLVAHAFGWALVAEVLEDGSVAGVYPARVSYRGFDEKSQADGYRKLSIYLEKTASELRKEAES